MPVGLVAVPLARAVLRESSLPGTRIDLLGMALATCGPVAVAWAIVHGESDGWTSRTVLGTFAAGAVLLAAFVLWERRARQPLLPLSLYRIRPFVLSNVVSVACTSASSGRSSCSPSTFRSPRNAARCTPVS
ncbi:hypothetical protein [Streptomyces pseudogriseolus]|uniref:hypothetical protein n=1 Tax=Streptomyces pseudogriseolus TaxID=36817 RepID=UPI00347185DF